MSAALAPVIMLGEDTSMGADHCEHVPVEQAHKDAYVEPRARPRGPFLAFGRWRSVIVT